MSFDLDDLVKRQMDRDAERTRLRPWLLERKNQRMTASAFAFLRGTAPFFYELLRQEPWLARGPAGEGWIVGDLHLENFGAFRTTSAPPRPNDDAPPRSRRDPLAVTNVVFDINDFDEAGRGPLRLDVLRLATSVLLAVKPADGVDLAALLVESYADALVRGTTPSAPPRSVRRLIERADGNTTKKMLARLTEGEGSELRFRYEGNLSRPSDEDRRRVEEAFGAYAQVIAAGDQEYLRRLKIRDVAFRVAGTGSLGAVRYAILTHGKEGKDEGWLFDMKEQGETSSSVLLGPSGLDPARRVLDATMACLVSPTRMLGSAVLDGRSMLVRRLSAQEDKLVVADVPADDLPSLLPYLAVCTAAAHRKGGAAGQAWSKQERAGLVDRALLVASFHEAAWRIFRRKTAA